VSFQSEVLPWLCSECGAESARWLGRCPACDLWHSIDPNPAYEPPGPRSIVDIEPTDDNTILCGIPSLDTILSSVEGAVLGGIYLLSGEPGIGKSTLLIQSLAGFAEGGARVLYVTGEESKGQIAGRARRVGALHEDLILHEASQWEEIEPVIDELEPEVLVLDSMQLMWTEESPGSPGEVLQIKAVCKKVIEIAKKRGICALLVAHVTKDGDVGGPKAMEHMVDTTLVFEGPEGDQSPVRFLRAKKNRFNGTEHVGEFQMTKKGIVDLERLGAGRVKKLSSGKPRKKAS